MDKTSQKKDLSQMLAGFIGMVIVAVLKDIIVSAIKTLGKMVLEMWHNRHK